MKKKILDTTATTVDWQNDSTDICVLPVGSVEQHGGHLSLNVDCVEAEYFARIIAEELGAALLPVQPYATCLEHTWFRGSITLKPETLMQFVRDIADELERQNFRILVILNGHGGNMCLTPVVRDINRSNRRIKVLLVPFWEFCDSGIGVSGKTEIHAGEWETSLLMAIAPDSVKKHGEDILLHDEKYPLKQVDLTTFGAGYFNKNGVLGYPSRASVATGRKIVASIRKNIMPYLRDRIKRLRKCKMYSGMGGVSVRCLAEQDLPACMILKDLAGWNQTSADLEMFLRKDKNSCFGAFFNGELVATSAAISYGKELSWIGMVLVKPEYRGMGIGKTIVEKAVAYAKRKTKKIMLDATSMGKPLYEKMGFHFAEPLLRMTGFAEEKRMPELVKVITENDMPEIRRADKKIFMCDRSFILDSFRRRIPSCAFAIWEGNKLYGYCFAREGSNFYQIGPVVAREEKGLEKLISAALFTLRGNPVMIDILCNDNLREWLIKKGFTLQRGFSRMYLGTEYKFNTEYLLVPAGPELG